MTDKKFTDEEIIRNYEWCIGCTSDRCKECTMDEEGFCEEELQDLVLDLINRQKVEIERLQKEVNLVSALFQDLQERTDEIKAEAYKEFAEKIKKSIKENVDEAWHRDDGNGIYDAEYVLDDIDNLLKEMVGEEE